VLLDSSIIYSELPPVMGSTGPTGIAMPQSGEIMDSIRWADASGRTLRSGWVNSTVKQAMLQVKYGAGLLKWKMEASGFRLNVSTQTPAGIMPSSPFGQCGSDHFASFFVVCMTGWQQLRFVMFCMKQQVSLPVIETKLMKETVNSDGVLFTKTGSYQPVVSPSPPSALFPRKASAHFSRCARLNDLR